MSEGWLLKVPMKGAAATVRIDGEVTYEALAKLAEHILSVGDYLREPGTDAAEVVQRGTMTLQEEFQDELEKTCADLAKVTQIAPAARGDVSRIRTAAEADLAGAQTLPPTGRPRADCHVCGANVTVTEEGTLRVHGPKANRCPGTDPNPVWFPVVVDPSTTEGHTPEWPDDDPPNAITSLDAQAATLF